MNRRGVARFFEIVLTAIIVILGYIILSRMFSGSITYISQEELRSTAYRLLLNLDRDGSLHLAVYGESGEGDPGFLKKIIEETLPPEYGYKVVVYKVSGDELIELFSISGRGYSSRHSSSIKYLLGGFKGIGETRLVVISISRGG
ncbi:MAG: hypothetical protein DRJ52_04400 [Thermoprotei archaeon]|nr:MAG: hypothetical protein DRJ52_04400 [Thermoprotei archaeon]